MTQLCSFLGVLGKNKFPLIMIYNLKCRFFKDIPQIGLSITDFLL